MNFKMIHFNTCFFSTLSRHVNLRPNNTNKGAAAAFGPLLGSHAAFLVLNCVGLMPEGLCSSLNTLALEKDNNNKWASRRPGVICKRPAGV